MRLGYNDGQGTLDIVTFLVGADFIDDVQLKCKIRKSDHSEILSIWRHWISLKIQILHQFHRLLQIRFAKAILSQLCRWNTFYIHRYFHHFRKKWWVITLAYTIYHFQSLLLWQKQEKFHTLLRSWKDADLYVWLIFLALHTSVPGIQSWKKIIVFERNQITTLVPKLPWITLFWHNQDEFYKLVANSLACKLMEQQFLLIIILIMFTCFSWRIKLPKRLFWQSMPMNDFSHCLE